MKRNNGVMILAFPLLIIFISGITVSFFSVYALHAILGTSVSYLILFYITTLILSGTVFMIMFFRTVSIPIELLSGSMRKIAEGDYDRRIPKMHCRKLEDIALSFYVLAEKIKLGTNDLLVSEKRHRMITENSSDIIFTFDTDGIIRFVNKRTEIITGYSGQEIEGRHISEFPVLSSQKDLLMSNSVGQWFPALSTHDFEIPFITKNGVRLILDVRLVRLEDPDGQESYLGVAHDITEKQRLYHQVIQSEKLSSLGELVAGVAHELNNPLTGVLGYAELMRQGTGIGESLKHDLDKIIIDATRAKKIVQNLLVFARKSPPEKAYADLNEIIMSVLEVREYEMLVNNIEVERIFEKNLPHVLVDPHQMRQVFLNIINNAINAMKAIPQERNLTIITSSDSRFIKITIHDTGPGIPGEYIDKVFDPFFTTMDVGKGIGMGLSVSYGIIKEHGGRITASTRRGEGTQFIIELPVINVRTEPVGIPVAETSMNTLHMESFPSIRVLLIEDDESLLHLIERVLRKEGSRVDTASAWSEALKAIKSHKYDVLVSDSSVEPSLASDFWEHIERDSPSLLDHMILISGETQNNSRISALQRRVKILMKPFTIEELKQSIRGVVEQVSPVR